MCRSILTSSCLQLVHVYSSFKVKDSQATSIFRERRWAPACEFLALLESMQCISCVLILQFNITLNHWRAMLLKNRVHLVLLTLNRWCQKGSISMRTLRFFFCYQFEKYFFLWICTAMFKLNLFLLQQCTHTCIDILLCITWLLFLYAGHWECNI